jgi:LacI family transcriptional regulator
LEFIDRKVDGMIVASELDASAFTRHTGRMTPVVFADRSTTSEDEPGLSIPGERAADLALEHLRSHVRAPLSVIQGPQSAAGDLEAWSPALRGADVSLVIRADDDFAGGESAMRELLARGRAGGVLVQSDAQAIGAIHACVTQGVRVGRDISIVSCGATNAGRYASPALTSSGAGAERVAGAAVHVLQSLIEGDPIDPDVVRLEARLRLGASCGCAA